MQTQSAKYLPVMECFSSIQGEGYHTGKPAYFVRLQGCDVGCHWCDVKESWPMDEGELKSVDEIVTMTVSSGLNHVVVTGGEPTLYDLNELTQKLKSHGLFLQLETSGTQQITGTWDWITLSPKKVKPPVEDSYQKAHELKVVIYNRSDFRFAVNEAAKVAPHCTLTMQPEWSKRDSISPEIVDFIKKDKRWRVSLQTHKFLGIP
ncbi:MAG: 7-carboxy-7-deazaguanine synthase QueE [Salibacteraceae bacterium]